MSEIVYRDPHELVLVQSRAGIDDGVVAEYAEMMRDGVEFDPASAVEDEDGTVYVWDGFHRAQAAKAAGKLLAIQIEAGSRPEATWLALSANQKHGLRRSRADKRKVVYEALVHPNGVKLSDREIGRHCGVSHPTVGQIRKEMETTGKIYQSNTRIGADGREYNTAKIGASTIDYVEIWELERGIRFWLAENGATKEKQFEILTFLKKGTPVGREVMEIFVTMDVLPGPRRKRDIIQAMNNVFEQMRVSEGVGEFGSEGVWEQGAGSGGEESEGVGEYVEIWELEEGIRNWLSMAVKGDRMPTLIEITNRTETGIDILNDLVTGDLLPGPRWAKDVLQACDNVLKQLKDEEREQRAGEQGAGESEVPPGEVCVICGQELAGLSWPSKDIKGRFTCEEHQGQTIDEYMAAKQAKSQLATIQRWVDTLVRVIPDEPEIEARIAELEQLSKKFPQMYEEIETLRIIIKAILRAISIGKVDLKIVSWLVTVPPGDINFKNKLGAADLATAHYALALVPGEGNKVKIQKLTSRINALKKSRVAEPQGRPELTSMTEATFELTEDPTADELKRAIRRFEAVPAKMLAHWYCGRCDERYPPGERYNNAEFSKGICERCLVALHRLSGPKPLICPRCRQPAIGRRLGGGLRCECGADWPHLRALREEQGSRGAGSGGEESEGVGEWGRDDEVLLRRLEIIERFSSIVDGFPADKLDTLELVVNDLAKYKDKRRIQDDDEN